MSSPQQGHRGPMPHSQPKNWQAELGLKQMLNVGVGWDGQRQDRQCPDAAGGLRVCRTASRVRGNGPGVGGRGGSGWRGQIQQGSQREGNGAGGAGWPASSRGLSLPATGLETLGVRAHPGCQICPLLTLPSTNSPQAWGAHILSPTPQCTVCGPHLPAPLPAPRQLTWAQVSLRPDG